MTWNLSSRLCQLWWHSSLLNWCFRGGRCLRICLLLLFFGNPLCLCSLLLQLEISECVRFIVVNGKGFVHNRVIIVRKKLTHWIPIQGWSTIWPLYCNECTVNGNVCCKFNKGDANGCCRDRKVVTVKHGHVSGKFLSSQIGSCATMCFLHCGWWQIQGEKMGDKWQSPAPQHGSHKACFCNF